MRNRILCLVLLGLLVLPVGGWAKISEIDPDGQQVTIEGAGGDWVPVAESVPVGLAPSDSSFWGILTRWLESLGLSF